jgi:O-antigen/teichoic acid export membrane protein
MLKKIVSHTFFYSFANQSPALINLFLLPFLTPFLSASDYAIYGLILSYAGLVGAFSSLGYIVLFQQSYFELGVEFKSKWSRLLGFQWLYKFIYAALVAALLYISLRNKIQTDRLILVLALVIVPLLFFDLTKSIATRLLQFRHEHQRVYSVTIGVGILSAFISFAGVRYFNLGYMAWLYSQAISSALLAAYFGYFLYVKENIRPSFHFNKNEIVSDLKIATPLIPKEYATYLLSSSDRVLLDRFGVAQNKIGQYSIAYSFASYFENIQAQANQVLTPIVFDLYKTGTELAIQTVGKLVRAWFYISLLIAAVLGLWIPDIFRLLYRKAELSAAYPMAIILIFGFCYRPIYVAIVDKAIFEKRTMEVLKITVVAALSNVVLNLIFIGYYETWAATFNTVIAYFIMGLAGYFLIKNSGEFRRIIRPFELIATIVIIGVAVFLMRDLSWLWRLLATGVLLFGMIIWLKTGGRKMWNELNNWRHGLSSH